MRNSFDFSDLEAFLAVKEAGSFHHAAAKPTRAANRLQNRAEATFGDAQDTISATQGNSVRFAFQRKAISARCLH